MKSHFANSNINLDDISPIVIAENPPWLTSSPIFNFELTKYKKYFPNPLLIQQHFAEISSTTSKYSAIHTDGSNDGNRVASAAVFRQQVYSLRLLYASSIFSAVKFVASSDESRFMICSDLLSCLSAIESCKTQNNFI